LTLPIARTERDNIPSLVQIECDDVHGQSKNLRCEGKIEMILDGGHIAVTISESV
jgi:hypothetical protein